MLKKSPYKIQASDDEIKSAMVEWASGEYQLGKDVIPTRILQGVYGKVSGIGQAVTLVAVTDSPDDTPSLDDYSVGTVPMSPGEYAVLTADRITIERG